MQMRLSDSARTAPGPEIERLCLLSRISALAADAETAIKSARPTKRRFIEAEGRSVFFIRNSLWEVFKNLNALVVGIRHIDLVVTRDMQAGG